MQLSLKDGAHKYKAGDIVEGRLRWHGDEIIIKGDVKWTTGLRLGVKFAQNKNFKKNIKGYLSPGKIALSLKPIHESEMDIEIPANLKYWLRADGPMEFFIWRHLDGEISKFQIILMEKFIEWADGMGVKTGKLLSKRDLDTPLITEDEFFFQIDEVVEKDGIDFAMNVMDKMNNKLLSLDMIDFIKLKLHVSDGH